MGMFLMVVSLCFFFFNPWKALSSIDDTSSWLSIDCGASTESFDDDLLTWETDDEYIFTGMNIDVSHSQTRKEMNTLRFFPAGKGNCYVLPWSSEDKVLLRAGFYYGNYDSLSKPPTFDLQFDGFRWATVVTTSGEDPIYHEAVYTPKKAVINVCLINTGNGVPFISSLEVTPWPSDLYRFMTGNLGFYLRSRTNFGADEDIRYGLISGDIYNRIWKAKGMENYTNVSTFSFNKVKAENDPPSEVLDRAIEAPEASASISLLMDLPRESQTAYIILYFMSFERSLNASDVCKFAIYIDGRPDNRTVELKDGICQVASFYPVSVTGPTSVTLSPVEGSTLPPLVNAMEVYTATGLDNGSGDVSSSCHGWLFFFRLLVAVLIGVTVFE
uniref:Uncharacterized protein At1g24485 n=1 Tax=Anthurium amnicola TaxID=1678845 RepID=A0A1D1ZCT3_9ARAE